VEPYHSRKYADEDTNKDVTKYGCMIHFHTAIDDDLNILFHKILSDVIESNQDNKDEEYECPQQGKVSMLDYKGICFGVLVRKYDSINITCSTFPKFAFVIASH
jgi:hypothetical protein